MLIVSSWGLQISMKWVSHRSTVQSTSRGFNCPFYFKCLAVVLVIFLQFGSSLAKESESTAKPQNQLDQDPKFTHQWAIRILGGQDHAKEVATKHGFEYMGAIFEDYYFLRHRRIARRSVRPSPHAHRTLAQESSVRWVEQQVARKRVKRAPKSNMKRDVDFNDPKWNRMWYLKDKPDMQVSGAWRLGITGKGAVVTILDDGLETGHKDIKDNYDPLASFDVNSNDPDPTPRYDFSDENRHGTRCAGEVAAKENNNDCIVGVAFGASIGGVRMLDGDVTDAVEAKSLSLEPQHVDIYSASWGPDDDGKTVDGPATLARKAFQNGVKFGRGKLGSIYVWASGNGGRDSDDCNCDGYTNSVYTLSISSATENGNIPWYSEACSSTLATTYSSGSGTERQIVTTDLHGGCTEGHTGTSASAPLAAGMCALALDANPRLTWRDMQYVVVHTSNPGQLSASGNWNTNGVGRKVSHSFGYGLMDATEMVKLAANWTTVPPQHVCHTRSPDRGRYVPVNSELTLSLLSEGCASNPHRRVRYLEHVQAEITLQAAKRGDVEIFLISPSGTRSRLLSRRPNDSSGKASFNKWPFMSTHCWGENPVGTWKLIINNHDSAASNGAVTITDWNLILYGVDKPPHPDHKRPHHSGGRHKGSHKKEGSFPRRSDQPKTFDPFAWYKAHKDFVATTTVKPPPPSPETKESERVSYYYCGSSSQKSTRARDASPSKSPALRGREEGKGDAPVKPTSRKLPNGPMSKSELEEWSLVMYGVDKEPETPSVKPSTSSATTHSGPGRPLVATVCTSLVLVIVSWLVRDR